jgi:flagellar protein FliJ
MTGPSFRFRLERIRALRERSEDIAKQAFAGAMIEHLRYEEELRAAAERVARAKAAQLDAATGNTTSTDLLAHQAYLERSERAHASSRHQVDRHEVEVERRRQELISAARAHKALERLKEHRRAIHEKELARAEGRVLDEIGVNGFRRRAA